MFCSLLHSDKKLFLFSSATRRNITSTLRSLCLLGANAHLCTSAVSGFNVMADISIRRGFCYENTCKWEVTSDVLALRKLERTGGSCRFESRLLTRAMTDEGSAERCGLTLATRKHNLLPGSFPALLKRFFFFWRGGEEKQILGFLSQRRELIQLSSAEWEDVAPR